MFLNIDGQKLSAEPGANVLETALANDIYIPHLCHDAELRPYGGCRLCLVVVVGARGFQAACTTIVAEGMVITTNNAELERVRRDTLELLLAEHPLDCLVCVRNQHCELQKAVAYIGGATRNLRRTNLNEHSVELMPSFSLTREYCVLCQKCVRACDEIARKKLLTVVDRGAKSHVATFAGQTKMMDACAHCLECVKRCPTAALQLRS